MANNQAPSSPGGKPAHMKGASCQECGRIYFPLLLVRPTVVDARYQGILRESDYVYASSLDEAFGKVQRQGTVPAVRLLADGYVLVFYKDRSKWDVWRSFNDGTLKKLLEQVTPDEYATMTDGLKDDAKGSVCARGASNLPAGLITLVGPNTQSEVWLAYTPHLWAPQVLKDYTSDKQGVRASRMTLLKAKAWIEDGTLPDKHALLLNADALQHNVIEFNVAVPKTGATGATILTPFAYAVTPLASDRLGKAQAMDLAVRAVEKTAGPKSKDKALIVMLQDPFGVAAEHNQIRLMAVESKKAWSAGEPDYNGQDADLQHPWKLRSSLHVQTIEDWAIATARNKIRDEATNEIDDAYGKATEEQYKAQLASGKLPPGTTWTPDLDRKQIGLTDLFKADTYKPHPDPVDKDGNPIYRQEDSKLHPGTKTTVGQLHAPSEEAKQWADSQYGGSTDTGRRDRYRKKLRFRELSDWRTAYQKASDRWDTEVVFRRDADFITWLQSAPFDLVVRNDFDWTIDLTHPNASAGTIAQQVGDAVARVMAAERSWGGGVLGPDSGKFFVAMLDRPINDPQNLGARSLVQAFNAVQVIADDPGKRKDTAEKMAGLYIDLPEAVKKVVEASRERLGKAAEGVLTTSEHALHLATAAVDESKAKIAGVPKTDPAKLEAYYKFNLRTKVLLDQAIKADISQTYVSVGFKIPVGDALDAVADALSKGHIEASIVSKPTTTRAERRQTSRSLRKLSGRPGLNVPEKYPVVMTRETLAQIQKQAARAGEELIEVVPDDILGGLKQPFRLPKSLATKLIGEQASAGRATFETLLSRGALPVHVLAIFQVWALIASLKTLKNAKGYDYVDALMSVFSCLSGMTQGTLAVSMMVIETRTTGVGLKLVPRAAANMSLLRLASGLAGPAGSAFDAVGAFAKYQARKNSGDAQAANEYFRAGLMFSGSAASMALGAGVLFAESAGGSTVRALAGFVVERVSIAIGLEAIGAALTGVGIVVGILGFGWSLYALYMEDDLNDTFLKRSYWGIGDQPIASFGDPKPVPARSPADALKFATWVKNGLTEETDAFAGLTLGVKVTMEWSRQEVDTKAVLLKTPVTALMPTVLAYKHLTAPHILTAKLESLSSGDDRRVSWAIAVKDGSGKALKVLGAKDVVLKKDQDSGHDVLEIVCPLDDSVYRAAQQAEFSYKLYERDPRDSLSGDTLRVKKN